MIAINGKTLRRSFCRAAGRCALHMVTAFAADARLVLGQKAVAGGGNEITALHELLGLVDCRDALATVDAIHCNAPTAEAIVARGGDYLLALKANRPATLKDVKDYLADPAAVVAERHETFARVARAHLGIGQLIHWALNTVFNEDRNRARKDQAAENLATI